MPKPRAKGTSGDRSPEQPIGSGFDPPEMKAMPLLFPPALPPTPSQESGTTDAEQGEC
jgi:hypothetical protein